MLMLNLGCGDRFAAGWQNFDFVSVDTVVQRHNLLEELPFADNSVDVIYNSHVLEHFSSSQAMIFLSNCYRKLKPGGVIRIVVPDLENICREYLKTLNHAVKGDPEYIKKYRWMMVELLDQMVRSKPGGEMADFWRETLSSGDVAMIDYIRERTGRNLCLQLDKEQTSLNRWRINISRIKHILLLEYVKLVRLLIPSSIRDVMFEQVPFGEKHRWMYDHYSLKNMLESLGFGEVEFVGPDVSRILNFSEYCLDCEKNHTPYKRSSLYCEALK